MTTDTKPRKKAKRASQETVIQITVAVEKLKSSGKVPKTLSGVVRHLKKELGFEVSDHTVRQVCKTLEVELRPSRRAPKPAQQIHWRREAIKAMRQLAINLEEELNLEPGCLLRNGVDEMLTNMQVGANCLRNYQVEGVIPYEQQVLFSNDLIDETESESF